MNHGAIIIITIRLENLSSIGSFQNLRFEIGLVLLLGEVAGVEDAGEPVESLNGEAQMGIFDSAHQVEADQLALEHKITVQRIARTLHICNITRIVMAKVNSTPAR